MSLLYCVTMCNMSWNWYLIKKEKKRCLNIFNLIQISISLLSGFLKNPASKGHWIFWRVQIVETIPTVHPPTTFFKNVSSLALMILWWRKFWRYFLKGWLTDWLNELMTKVFLEPPWLHQVYIKHIKTKWHATFVICHVSPVTNANSYSYSYRPSPCLLPHYAQ